MKPINYSNTVMYKIVPKDLNLDLQYVGHTTNFRKRKSQHKESCNNLHYKRSNLKVYQMIRDNGGWDEWEMIEIEKFPCNDGNEARTRERYWYELYNANLNSRLPLSSQKEYCEKNKDTITIYKQKWAEKNKDKCIASKFKYYEKNKDVINAKNKERYQKKKALELENK